MKRIGPVAYGALFCVGLPVLLLVTAWHLDARLGIASDAREALLDLLSGDRLLNRRELEKLVTYAAGQGTVTLQDVEAVMADAKAAVLDTVIDAIFLGQVDVLDRTLARLFAEGDDAGVTISPP